MLRLFLSAVLVLTAICFASDSAISQTPDLSGTWDRVGAAKESPGGAGNTGEFDELNRQPPRQTFTLDEVPMQPWAREKYAEAREGSSSLYESGKDEIDPTYNCFPPGFPRILTGIRPFEIHQLPKVILMLFESDHWVRRIYMDGRGHPDGYPPSWMGHSIGKWQGDTLLVDTVSMDPRSWLDGLGHPMSDALHVEERIRRPSRNSLEIDLTFDDPKTYTRPWKGKKVFELMPPGYEVLEDIVCGEYLEIGHKRSLE